MKVIMSSPWVYPFHLLGGMERYIYFLSKHLVEQGIDVKIITSPGKNKSQSQLYEGIEYEFIGSPIPVYRKYAWLFHYIFNVNLARHLKKERFDILHSFHITSFVYLHLNKRKPVIIEPFGLGKLCEAKLSKWEGIFREFLLKRPLMYCMTHAEAIAAEGDIQTQELASMFRVPKEKFFNLPDGVELGLVEKYLLNSKVKREDFEIHDADIVLINVNRLDRNKGVPYLIDGLSILNQELNVKLILVGAGPEEDKIKRQVERLKLGNKVIHFKGISDEEMFQLYTLADISVTPTLWEGLPLVVLEAMAAGKPIVATNVADIPNVINGNGIVIPPGDIEAIVEAILTIYRHDLVKTMGKRSREIIRDYDWKITAKKAMAKYEELCQVHHPLY